MKTRFKHLLHKSLWLPTLIVLGLWPGLAPGQGFSGGHTNIAFYSFDDDNLFANDFSGQGNGIAGYGWFGSPPYLTNDAVSGPYAVGFTGSGWLSPPADLATALEGSFTVSLWLRTTNVPGTDTETADQGVGIVGANVDLAIPMAQTGHKLGFLTGGNPPDTLNSATAINSGNYTHLVVTRDQNSGQKMIYINGNLDASDVGTAGQLTSASRLAITLGAIPGSASDFIGEMDQVEFYSGVLSASEVAFLFNHPSVAVPDVAASGPPIIALGAAVNAAQLPWTTYGSALWFGESSNSFDGVAAAQSGVVVGNQTSVLQTIVTGPGTLVFQWQTVGTGADFDCQFGIDGNDAGDIGPGTGWTQATFAVPPGRHVLTWTALANGDTGGGEAAYLDQVVFTFDTGSENQTGGHTLVAHYTFDDSANLGADTSGNGFDLDYNGNPSGGGVTFSTSAEAGSGAAYFDGGSFLSYSAMPAPVLATLAGSFTISVWVNTTQTFGFDGDPAYTDAGIVAADIPGQYNDIVPLALTGGGLGFNTGGSSDDTLSSTLDINDGNYHHIVVERNQALGEKWIFIDGVYNNTDFATTNLLDDPVLVAIGCAIDASDPDPTTTSTSGFYNGLLDDLQIYSGLLNTNEIASLFNRPGTTAPSVNANGLMAHYTFDNPNNLGADSAGNGYDLDYNGDPSGNGVTQSSAAEAGSGAAYFDGGSFLSYLTTPGPVLSALAGSFTLSFWINTTQTYGNDGEPAYQGAGLVAADIPGQFNDIIPAALDGGQIGFNTGGAVDDTLNSQTDINDGNYHHIVVTRDQATGEKQIYVDGNLDNDDSATTNWLSDPRIVAVGCQIDASQSDPSSAATANFFQGWLDDIQIYNRVLNPFEIAMLYNNPGQTVGVPPDFNAALNTTNLPWITYGNSAWFVESTNTYDGVLAAQSGTLFGNDISVLAATVTGPVTLYFWWQSVGDDFLTFSIDDNYVTAIYNQSWAQAGPYVIGPGQHNLSWTSSAFFGNGDAEMLGYLDQVTFTNIYPPQITQQPAGSSVLAGSNVVLTATVLASPSANLQWLDNGNVIPGATNATLIIPNAQPADSGNYELTATNYLGSTNTQVVGVTVYLATDLAAVSLDAPAVVGSQTWVSLVWTVTNTGPGGASSGFVDSVYLETNGNVVSTLNYGHGPVPPGSTATFTNRILFPSVAAGSYTLALKVDSQQYVFGNNGLNSTLTGIPITVLNPDLQPTALQVTGPGVSGLPMQFVWTVANNGSSPAGDVGWYDSFYLSTNAVWGAGTDYLVGSAPGLPFFGGPTNLTPGTSITFTNLVYPPLVPAGDYYVILFVNQNGAVFESDTANNQIAVPIHLGIPDLVATNLIAPTVVGSRGPVSIEWMDLNEGDGVAEKSNPSEIAEWHDSLYLSTNQQINASSLQLGNYVSGSYAPESFAWNTPLLPGRSLTNLQTLTIPNVAAGNYFVVLWVNSDNSVQELDQTNNYSAIPVTVAPVDLAPTAFAAPPAANSRSTIQISWNVTNDGSGTAYPQWVDNIYISPNATMDAQATLLGSFLQTNQLVPGTNYLATNQVTLPGIAAGNYFLILDVNAATNVLETNLANNFLALPIKIGTPDLAATSLIVLTNLSSQQPISPVWSVENAAGVIALPGWGDELFLSPDAGLDSNAIPLVSYSYNGVPTYYYYWNAPLPVGSSYTNLANVIIPGVPAGDYFVLVDADANNFFAEANPANNVLAQPVHISNPDLTPTNFDAPGVVSITQLNQQIETDWSVVNQGAGTAFGSWGDNLYLSATNVLDNTAIYLGSAGPGTVIAPGQSYVSFLAPTVPNNMLGNYFLILEANADHSLYESTYTNNTLARPIQIILPPTPVLSLVSVQAPADAWSGQPIEVSWVLTNSGSGAVQGTFNDQVVLATDAQGDNAQVYGTYPFTGQIPAGGSVLRTASITLPISLSGLFWVQVQTDVNQAIFQYTYRTNETLTAPQPTLVHLTPTPQLAVLSVQGPTNLYSGDPAEVSWVVTNEGNGPTSAPYWSDAVYFSQSTNYNQPDFFAIKTVNQASVADSYYLGEAQNASFLNPGQAYQNSLGVTIPSGIEGTFYFIVRADDDDQVFETNRSGNILVSGPVNIQLTPPPDLQVVSVIPPPNAFSGQPVFIQWAVTNFGLGQTIASNWYDGVFLCSNNVLDASAISLGTFPHVGGLDPNAGYVATNTVTLPIGVSGNWYFIVTADVDNNVYEGAFEDSKTTAASFATLIALTPPPDLQAAILQAPASALASHAFEVTYSVLNVGSTATPGVQSAWSDNLYLSSHPVFDGTAQYLTSFQHAGALAPGAGYTNTLGAVLPDTLTGTFYVYVLTDAGDQVFELNKTNNLAEAAQPVQIVSAPADLVVMSLQAPATANTAGAFLVSWAVTNEGIGDTAVASWSDELVLSQNIVLGAPSDVVLLSLDHDGLLGAGQSYAVTNQLAGIPSTTAAGKYYLFLITDAGDNVYEGTNHNRNVYGPLPISITSDSADLDVTVASGPASAVAGSTITVPFTVMNSGDRFPNNSSWIDAVYLTTNGLVADPTTVLLGYSNNVTTLAPGASYTNALNLPLPANVQGVFYLAVVTDAGDNVSEPGLKANNTYVINPPITITLGPVPDLVVTNVIVPASAAEGQPFNITWTVQNVGAVAARGNWIDAAYLSLDQTVDFANDIYLGLANNLGSLAPGASYTNTASFVIPQGLAGPYYVSITADFDNVLSEVDLDNNTAFSPQAMTVELLPPVDLVAGMITIPANAVPGQNMTIAYSVFNSGSNTATGSWEDAIYISPTTNWLVTDPLFATVQHTGDVPPNAGYTNTVTAVMPPVQPGDYYVIVHSDILNHLGGDQSNNVAASLGGVSVSVPQLTLGVPVSGTIGDGQSAYYSFYATNGETIHIQFTSGDPLSGNEILVSEGQLPSLEQFDYAADQPFVANPGLYLPITNSGTYYVVAYGQYETAATNYGLLAEVEPFSVATAQPTYAGDQGQTTFFVQGALLDASTVFELVNGTNILTSLSTTLEDSSTAYVTFDLAGVADGVYDLTAIAGGSNQVTATLTAAVTVVPGVGPNVAFSIVGPSAVAEPDCCAVTHAMSVAYGNDGDSDTPAPLILVDGEEGTLIGLTPYSLQPQEVELLGRNQQAPLNVLRPQDSDTEQMYFLGSNEHTAMHIFLPTSTLPLAASDWTNIEASVRPPGVPDAAWNPFWLNIQGRVGPTWGNYVQFLDYIAQEFPSDQLNVASMIGYLYTNSSSFQASAIISGTLLGDTDQLPQAGVTIGFYTVTANGVVQLGGSTVTDNNGQFSVAVLPGQYSCAVANSPYFQFDMAQAGQADNSAPSFNLTKDLYNQTIYLYEPPAVMLPTNDVEPTLTLDSQGTLHAFWYRNDLLWSAWNNNGSWVGAAPISTNYAVGFCAAAAPNLINGSASGLIVVWAEEETNGTELFYSVSQTATNGAYQWSQPVMLTDDAVQNASPAVVVRPDGLAVITYLKCGFGYQDDTDVYYSTVNVASGALVWTAPAANVAAQDASDNLVHPNGNGMAVDSLAINWNPAVSVEFNVFGGPCTLKAGVSGSAGVTGCTGTGTLDASVSAGLDMANWAGSVSGSGGGNLLWNVDPNQAQWVYNANDSRFNLQFQMSAEAKNAGFTLLKLYPPTSPFISGVEEIVNGMAHFCGCTFGNSIGFTGGVKLNGCAWSVAPLNSFGLPTTVDSAIGNFGGSLKLELKQPAHAGWLVDLNVGPQIANKQRSASVSGSLGFVDTFSVWPEFKNVSLAFNGAFSMSYGAFTMNPHFNFDAFNAVAEPHDDTELLSELNFAYNPAAVVGTTNVYGTNAVLSTVATDLYMDGAPALATDAAGVPYQVWYKDGDPYATTNLGSQLYVADYNGANWNPPAVIPGSLGLNSYVCAATDGAGNRLAVWVHADESGITTNVTAAQFFAAQNASDVYFATGAGTNWTAPQVVAATPGLDADLSLSSMANGNVLAVWTYTDTNLLVHLVSSTWNGSAWTPLAEITSGTLNAPTAQQAGGATVVLWTAVLDTNNDSAIYESQNVDGNWSKPSPFAPALLASVPGPSNAVAIAANSVAPKTASVFDLAIDPSCLKCGGYSPSKPVVCPITSATYNYNNTGKNACSWIYTYTYKPCSVHPLDPNAMVGPVGFGPQQWVPTGSPLDYTVEFANSPTLASAPAQQVSITVPLDPNLDSRTFRLGSFGFGGLFFTVPTDSAFYQTQIDLTATGGYDVDVFAGVDIANHQAFWTFTTIDPATGTLPANPLVGFLPPDTNAPNGEGFVSYSVSAAAADLTGAQVAAQATIVFNGQPPMSTPTVFNTLEAGTPTSAVQPLPAYTFSPTFNVSWQGVNVPGGLSITAYDIYFSVNGGSYVQWLGDTTLGTAPFTGQPGNTYAFYSIAHDSAGDVQIPPAVPDTTTYISSNLPPVLAPITNVVVVPDGLAAVPISATDPNGDQLTYSLGAVGPANAHLKQTSTNATFYWTPTRAYAETTNLIAAIVTDNGVPPLSSTQTFLVTVLDYLQVSIGSTNVQGGQASGVPISLASSGGVSNLTFAVQLSPNLLTNLSLLAVAPQIAQASLQDFTTNVIITLNAAAGQSLSATQTILQLNFTAATNPASAFVALTLNDLAALKPSGESYVNYLGQNGSVAVVESQALLSAAVGSNQVRNLVLYGKLNADYRLQYTTNLTLPQWQPLMDYIQTNGAITISLDSSNRIIFYRLQQQ